MAHTEACPRLQNDRRFRRDNAEAITAAARRFIDICRDLGLASGGVVAVDGSKLWGVNAHNNNYTRAKLARRVDQVEARIEHLSR